MNLCGHGTIAALAALETTELRLQIETKSGILPASRLANGMFRLRQEGRPELQPFEGNIDRVLASIGLELKHLDDR
nr:hypothetical protein [Exiguobacterium sp. SL14]